MVINWKIFDKNTSTREALQEFVLGFYNFKDLEEECWPKECKIEVCKMRLLGIRNARKKAKLALKRMGVEVARRKNL